MGKNRFRQGERTDGMKDVSIKDIADMAGVSVASVSYVLNGKKGVGCATREKIERIIKQYDYRPNLNSRRLTLNKSFNIHVVIRREAAPACKDFYFGVLAKMTEEIQPYGYNIASAFQSDDPGDTNVIEIIRNKNTDGILFFQGTGKDILAEMKEKEIPGVIINPGLEPIEAYDMPAVQIDFETLSYRATAYLAQNGHKKIGFMGMRRMPVFLQQTKAGFLKAVEEYGLVAHDRWVLEDIFDEQSAAASMHEMLAGGEPPTAMFCTQDNFAICGISAAKAAGHSVPGDISFIAIDDVPVAKYIDPPLTTIPVNPRELAKSALDMLFMQMNEEKTNSKTIPSHEIIVRKSVKSQ